MEKEFDKYKSMSPWRDEKEKRWMPLKFCLEKMAIKLVVSMGLRKSDYIVEIGILNCLKISDIQVSYK